MRYLKIVEKSGYQALPWVRYITQNGDDYRCVVRCRVGLAYVDFADVRAQSADCAGEGQRSDRPWDVSVWGLGRRCVCVLHCTLVCCVYSAFKLARWMLYPDGIGVVVRDADYPSTFRGEHSSTFVRIGVD